MSTDPAALASSADRLAEVRPDGHLALDTPLVQVLVERIRTAEAEDPTVPAAIEEGAAYHHAIDAGCPPAFHPGVPEEHAAVLRALRERLGLDRAIDVRLQPDADPSHARLLRNIGCELAAGPV